MDLLNTQMSGGLMDQLSRQIGAPQQQTQSAVDGIFGAVLNGLSKNVSSPQGANALMGALDRDHDGSILDDLAGFLGGQKSPNNTNMMNGAGILKHVLGNSQGGMVDAVSKNSGLDSAKIGQLLMTLAPMIMGVIGKTKSQNNLNSGGLADLISGSAKTVNQSSAIGNIFTSILDKNGDGNVIDDIAKSGIKSLFGRLFGRK